MAANDKCIGKLTLDTTGIDAAVKHVNDELKKLGAGVKVDLSKQVAAEVKKQLAAVEAAIKSSVKNIQNAANQATKAFSNFGSGKGNMQSLKSEIVDTTNVTRTLGGIMQSTGKIIEGILTETKSGYNALGEKVKEVTDVHGNLVKKIKDVGSQYKDALKTFVEYQGKLAQLTAMDMKGNNNTPQYAKLYAEVEALADRWSKVDNSVKAVVNSTDEAQRAARMYNDTIAAINAGQSAEAQEKALRNLVGLYQELYKYKAQADTFAQKGDIENADMYRKLAEGVQAYIDGIKTANAALDKQAQSQEEVVKANIEYQKTIQANQYKENTENIKAYSKALVDLHNAQANFNKMVASGELVEGTKRYADAEQEVNRLRQAATTAGNALDATGRKIAASSSEVQAAFAKMNDSAEKLNNAQPLNQVENAYNRLTAAIKNYNLAKKAGNEEGMISQQKEIDSAMAIINSIDKIVDSLNVEANVRDQIKQKIEQAKIAQDAQAKGVGTTSQATGELESQVKGLVTRYLSLMAVIRTISSLIKNMTEYVSEYSDKMNEIQMITLKTDSEVAQLAETYRGIAKEMNVSSLDMADAAIYFTRQGLEAEEIEKRLRNVTMYAKAANVEFKDASEIITAVVNSMGLVEQEAEDGRNAAQRVADVFLQIGDHAATSGQEIGEAMQKAAASAGAFGISMEWLASYIATVSETTRQEARTIGTAFNTIIARLHQIKSTGYNQEDETKVNDIAKALSKIDVVLMDQEGNWRDMEDILIDVASKWDGLDDKTKSYIATTMAGVKQQNVFLALMNDMSKGAENGSRAFELYNIAMDSTGVAAEKYSVYLDSVTAAQERLTIAQEEFYSILDEDIIKGWYNTLAGIVEWITKATEAMGGLNIVVPLVTGTVVLLAIAVGKVVKAAGSLSGMLTMLGAHPVIATIVAVTTAIGVLTAAGSLLGDETERMAKSFENATNAIANSQEKLKQYSQLQSDLIDSFAMYGDSADELNEKLAKTSENQEEYNQLLDDLASISPIAKQVVEQLKSGFIDQKEAASLLNKELERLIENEEKISMHNLLSRYANYQSNEKNTRDVATLAKGWESDAYSDVEDPEQRFRNILATTYGTGTLSKDLTERIKQAISDYIDSGMDVNEAWDTLATDILYEMFGSFKVPENMTQQLAEEVVQEVNYVMDVVGKDLDPANYAVVRESLMNALFGDDGQLDMNEYANFTKVIMQWVREILQDGPESIVAEMSNINIAETIAKTMFDPSYFGDLFKEQGEDFAAEFIDTYKDLIKEGFSEEEIKGIFEGIGQPLWNNAISVMKDRMQRAIKEEFGTDFLGAIFNVSDGTKHEDSLMWNDLDYGTLKLIHELAQSGVVDLMDINQMMLESNDDTNVFIETLKKFAETVGFVVEDIDDFKDAPLTMDEMVKKVKAGVKDIQAIDAAIKDVKENGADANLSDIFSLTETHPELMTVIGDTEALLDMLQKIRNAAGDEQRGLLKNILLGDEKAMAGSKYASSGFETLDKYRQTLSGEALAQFDAEVEAWLDVLMEANEDFKKAQKEEAAEAKEAAKSFSESVKEVEKFDKVIKKIEQNKAIDFSDVIDLSTAHPEIVAFAGDSEKLLEILKKLKSEAQETVRIKVEGSVLDSEEWMKNSKFANSGYKTASEYRTALTSGNMTQEKAMALQELDNAIKESTDNVVGLADAYATLEQDQKNATTAAKEEKNALKEAQKAFNDNLKEVETLDKVISKLQDDKKVDFSDIINLSSSHPEIVAYANDAKKLIEVLQRLKEEAKGTTKDSIKDILYDSEDYFKETKYYDPDSNIKTMREYITNLHESRGDWVSVAQEVDQAAQNIVDAADESSTAADTWLDAQMKIAEINDEVNWAKANHFQDQIRMLEEANAAGGIQAAIDLFDSWDDKMQQAVGTEYPAFILQMVKARKAMDDQGKETADLTKETEGLSSALKTASKMNSVKYFTDSAKAIKQLSEGTISATDAYDTFNKEVNKVSKAYEDILDVQAKLEYNAKEINKDNQQKIDAADVSNLASLLGMTTDQILQDFPGAVEMFDELTGGAGELMQMFDALNEAAFIRITGVSEVDFSNLENGLFAIRSDAEDVIKALEATGQWEVTTVQLPQSAQVWDPFKKIWMASSAVASATVLKPTGNNPFARQSTVNKKADTKQKTGRSGGGGGGSSKDKNDNFRDKNTTTEVEKMLDLMSQVNTIQGSQQNWYQSQQKYYSQTGKLQGVISYMQKEKDVLAEQNVTLEANIKRIEEYMEQKRAELAALSTTDESYKEVADDLDKLQKAHQTYSKQLIDNKTAMEALTESMDEQRKKIRQMEIDLRKTILDAIMDREEKRKNMLSAEIEMENTILELIKKKYETERDEIISTTDLKIESLKSERDLLDEQLRIRKEQAEAEDKALKLRELEAKYQRIIADPTRAKEAQSIKTEIDNMRKEMAWDLAENEIKSQQESIDQQIESLEDYKEYIENYYEDLFEHPQKLIAEMREIIMGTQEEIIQWLKDNDEAYRESSENTQEQMVEGWNETYENMKGILKDYWEEVEFIITQGDDYIIEFLKNNSAEYAKAGKLQAEAYVDEWKKQLSDLHKAYEAVASGMAVSYDTIKQYNGSGSSSSSSSNGGSSKGGGASKTTTTTANMTANAGGSHYYEFAAFGKNYSADKNSSGQYFANRGEAYSAAEQKIDALYKSQKAILDKNGANAYGYNQLAQAYKTAKNSIRAYKTGGIADYTGPAWVDGSPQDPERILTPYQNKLFETFVNTLEKMATITIPSMPSFDGLQSTGANPVSVGDIIVNVDNLDTEDDYETMAEKVGEILMERIGRSAVIGGLRIRSV